MNKKYELEFIDKNIHKVVYILLIFTLDVIISS
jgi:hypothetical protein